MPTWVRLDEALDAVMGGRLHNPSTVLGVLATAQARTRGWSGCVPLTPPGCAARRACRCLHRASGSVTNGAPS